MALFSSVPVVDVNRENFKSLWPSLILAIKSCSYVAMDAELSGLGNRKNLLTRSMEDRYQSLAGVAKTRSVLSLGISCFKVRSQPAGNQSATAAATQDAGLPFLAQTYNITTLCSEDYTVEPGSLKFLVDHGFDFNKQYSSGVPYHRGQDKEEGKSEDSQTLRALFSELIRSSKPVVFHNGLVDLVFLYQNFYTELPASFSQFISDLYEIFPGGIFDSKYLAEFEARMQASYLEYAFRKSQRANARLANRGQQHVSVEFCRYQCGTSFVDFHHCGLPLSFSDQGTVREAGGQTVELCDIYAAHGHCKNGISCPKSHDPDAIQDADERREERRRKKRKRRRKQHEDSDGFPKAKKDKEEDDDDDGGDSCHGDREMNDDCPGNSADAAGDIKDEIEFKEEESNIQAEVVATKSVNGQDKHSSKSELTESNENKSSVMQEEAGSPQKLPKQTGGHRAGYDAFMTGFIMASLAVGRHSGPSQPAKTDGGKEFVEAFRLTQFRNKLFLSAKSVPLLIAKSTFAKTSQNHRRKMKRLGIPLA